MLVLTRRKNESVLVDSDISVTILEIKGNNVKVGINAPRNVPVVRTELLAQNFQHSIKSLRWSRWLKRLGLR